MEETKKKNLSKQANEIRQNIINLVYSANSGHPGGSLSIADIITYLYFEELKNIDVNNPRESR